MTHLAPSLAALLAACPGCVGNAPFVCIEDRSCGSGGLCEPGGLCSFADSECHSGRRYGEHTTGEVAGQCVGDSTGPIAELTAGSEHTCARGDDGRIWCWGSNEFGALGTGEFADAWQPVAATKPGARAIVAGDHHTCALINSSIDDSADAPMTSAAWCWGRNHRGQLGRPGESGESLAPAAVAELDHAVTVAAGSSHSCAIDHLGAVWCWGDNSTGQLGDGTFQDSATPVRASGIDNATALVAGGGHTCAQDQEGAVSCWGRNHVGQLGIGNRRARNEPTAVASFAGATAIAIGAEHTCAVVDDKAFCTGQNQDGQLGDGSGDARSQPVPVTGLGKVVESAAGDRFTCALTKDGRALCWGGNASGELGTDDHPSSGANRPDKPVKLIRKATGIAAGGEHACAQTEDGCLWCWGQNALGQLGRGNTEPGRTPDATLSSCF